MEETDHTPRDASYWQAIYDDGDLGWDKGEPAPPFVRYIKESPLSEGSHILVPGCGLGHEVLFLARLGFQVTAVDFAESAVESLKARIGDLPVTVLQRDIFTLGEDHRASFDVVLEHTCFCAIPLAMRPAYSRTMHEVLKGGGRIIGLFYETDEEEGPPFRTTRSDIEEYFSGRFNITRIERPHDSFEARRGQEWFVEMTRL